MKAKTITTAAITKFDRDVAKMLGAEIGAALAPIAAKYALKIDAAGGSFSESEFTARISIQVTGAAADAAASVEFNRWCGLYGLQPKHFGVTIDVGGKKGRFIGIAASRSKFPFRIETDDGKTRVYSRIVLPLIIAAGEGR